MKLMQKKLNTLRVEVRMIGEEVLAGYQNVAMSAPGCHQHDYKLKKMSIVIDGHQTLDVNSKHHTH